MTAREYQFNGLHGDTGVAYPQPMNATQISHIVFNEPEIPSESAFLQRQHQIFETHHRGVVFGVDPSKLAEAGWGVIFPEDVDPEIRKKLQPLLDLRRQQAGSIEKNRYRELSYRPGETGAEFLERHKVGWGPADPDQMPYYLLLVGNPQAIPMSFQYDLLQYAIGRICFEKTEEYEIYAQIVIRNRTRQKHTVFFGPENYNDAPTKLSRRFLIESLAKKIRAKLAEPWNLETISGVEATKSRLLALLQNDQPPDLLFTASHGMYIDATDVRYPDDMGALVCADWPGPAWRKAIPKSFYVSSMDLAKKGNAPWVAFFFACYSAGIPRFHDFSKSPKEIASHTFIAKLPTRLLLSGSGAIVAHMDSAYENSFLGKGEHPQLASFLSFFSQLHQGHPVGLAMEVFRQRFASLHVHYEACRSRERLKIKNRKIADLAELWITKRDSRNYIIIGDPAITI